MPKYFRSLLIVGIVLLASQAIAVPPQPPVFLSNFDKLTTSYCDLVTYHFEAKVVDPPPGSDNPIRYHLISGPGVLDDKTGEWYWQPTKEDISSTPIMIEVAASIGGNNHTMTSGMENAILSVKVKDFFPSIRLEEYAPYAAIQLDEVGIYSFNILLYGVDTCDFYELYIDGIYPSPNGVFQIVDRQLVLDISEADLNKKFNIVLGVRDDEFHSTAWYIFDTRSEINLEFVSCPDTIVANFCDSLSVQFKATDYPPDTLLNWDGIYYRQLSGPGYFYKRGLYVFDPTEDDIGKTFDVSIEATYETNKTSYVATCEFSFTVTSYETEISLKDHLCGDTIVFDNRPLSWGIGLEGYLATKCDLQSIKIVSIEPEIIGTVVFDSSTISGAYYWFYQPDPLDGDKTIKLTFGMATDSDSIYCDLYLKNNWPPPEEKSFQVRIGYQDDVPLGSSVDLPVYLEQASSSIGGYDLLMEYDKRTISFQQATIGDQFGENGCGWEYFTYRFGDASYDPYYNTIRVVALAETNNGDIHPSCFLPDSLPVELFKLTFNVVTQYDRECQRALVRFRWADCSDNAMTGNDGQELYVSSKVFNPDINDPQTLIDITQSVSGYPTVTGFQPLECSDGLVAFTSINFINGGIHTLCPDTLGTIVTGDVNLNGIAFEIADLILFSKYFADDTLVFSNNVLRHSKTTDINGDGNMLTVPDWQVMKQIIIGEFISFDVIMKDTIDAEFYLNDSNHELEALTDATYGAMFVIVSGQVVPELLVDNMSMLYAYDAANNRTRIFVHSFYGESFGAGLILGNITGDLIYIEATDIDGRIIKTVINTENSYQIKIARVDKVLPGSTVTVPVYLNSASGEIGGFDLLLEYDSRILNFQMASIGEQLGENGCGWEYFTYRNEVADTGSLYQIFRIVAVAETNNGDVHPSCYLPGTMPAELFSVNFLVTNDRIFECDFAAIRFRWADCGDNTIAGVDGQEVYVANKVFTPSENNLNLIDITDPNTGFPTNTGFQPQTCSAPALMPAIDFINGGVDIICANAIDHRGDVNYNAISYEIADLVLFEKYFTRGTGVFIVDLNKQIEATDVNGNGTPLEVADWQYLLRIVIGEATPGYDFMFDTLSAEINYSSETKTLRAYTEMEYGAMYIVIRGNYTPLSYMSEIKYDYLYDDSLDLTRVFIYSTDGDSFGAGDILGNIQSEILDLQVADYEGHVVIPAMNVVMGVNDNLNLLPNQFGLAQNYPNPFNNATVISFSLPSAQEVEFEIFNILGKKVYSETKRYQAGIHQIYWEGNVASGVYYYRIKAGDKVATRKMMLLK